ncbi:hypothetical protein [Moorena sp. SIO3I6]|uniref:hypothetical protein n=1 Tax=Moorena sp. SIO3I6 TaxID=2607831 RepID=UPI0013FCC3F8|nr:hypothetical protein [Moorena sp. SIO3I6]NEP24253.1 hypothetical protein [Moorena sp. SIO3I6]
MPSIRTVGWSWQEAHTDLRGCLKSQNNSDRLLERAKLYRQSLRLHRLLKEKTLVKISCQ